MKKNKQYEYFIYATAPKRDKSKRKRKWIDSNANKVVLVLLIIGLLISALILRWYMLGVLIVLIYLELRFKLIASYFASMAANRAISKRTLDRQHFAEANNYEFQETAQFTSTIAIADDNNYVKNYIYGTIADIPFWTADSRYDYKIDHGNAIFTNHTVTGLFVENELPNFQIIRNIVSERDLLYLGVYTKDVLQITEQFDKKYLFKSPKGYERDALYIFTPELLELIIEFNPWLIETTGNLVVVHYDYAIGSDEDYRRLAEMIQQLGSEFIDNTKRYKNHNMQ